MTGIVVVGLGGRSPQDDWTALLEGRAIVARHGEPARRATPPGCTIDESLDDLIADADPRHAAESAAARVIELAESVEVAYLVPWHGALGDATVAALAERARIEILQGALPAEIVPSSASVIVDALELAAAEASAPFDTGIAPLSDRKQTLVLNATGRSITELARRRLLRTYAEKMLYVHSDGWIVASSSSDTDSHSADGMLRLVARLRAPGGCPWDREQTPASLLDSLREEVDEVAAAIGGEDWDNLREELGDVLLHVAMQAQIAAEEGRFTFDDVVRDLADKLVRRHPHVFGDVSAESAADVLSVWNRVKQEEKQGRTIAASVDDSRGG